MSKKCENCMWETLDVLDEPCLSCRDYSAWEPKEQKEEKMDEMVEMELELKSAKEENEHLKDVLNSRNLELARKTGLIDGLKYGIAAIVMMAGGELDE